MKTAPRGLRLHVALLGRRNVGKSSLLNALARQQVAIVSQFPGTTTDPVEKPLEMQPLGPVLFIDTAGLDDEGALGQQRIAATRAVLARADLALVVAGSAGWGAFEDGLLGELAARTLPAIVVFNQSDLLPPDPAIVARLQAAGLTTVTTVASQGQGLAALRQALIAACPADFLERPSLLGDLLPPGGLVVMVVPVDMEAPKGRLILPQVQAIRDSLDHDAMALVVKERELAPALARLRQPPDLVVTDSQGFLKVAADVPDEIPLTSFSILFARFNGDLASFAAGARAIDRLKTGDRVLIAEACTHHPIGDDIGRVKIPRWLTQYVGGRLEFTTVSGRDFPPDLSAYSLVIHCGACTFNRRAVLSRLAACAAAGVPVTNYGMAIAWSLGIFPRALRSFPMVAEHSP